MTTRCKPGDMAYIVGSDFPENIGRVVEVTSEGFPCPEGYAWVVRSSVPLKGWIDGPQSTGCGFEVWSLDDELRPISGVPIQDELTEDLREPA